MTSKFIPRLKTGLIAAGAFTATSMVLAQSAFNNLQPNGITVGKMAQNAAASATGVSELAEALLYTTGIIFLVVFVLLLWKWKKSEGREGSAALIAVSLVVSVFSLAAPTLVGSGMTTVFGSGNVQTVKSPAASFTGN